MSNLLEGKTLYIGSQVDSRLIKVTAIFADNDDANQYMDENPEEGAVDSINGLTLLANCSDLGVSLNGT